MAAMENIQNATQFANLASKVRYVNATSGAATTREIVRTFGMVRRMGRLCGMGFGGSRGVGKV